VEYRDQIFQQAFSAAVTELEEKLGKNPERWAWGDLHTVTFRNASLGESGIPPIEALFNRGPFPTSGATRLSMPPAGRLPSPMPWIRCHRCA